MEVQIPMFLNLFYLSLALIWANTAYCYSQPAKNELLWIPDYNPNAFIDHQIESVTFANTLSPPASLYFGYELSNHFSTNTRIKNRLLLTTCNVYTRLVGTIHDSTSQHVDVDVLDFDEILGILDGLPSTMTYQMATITAKRVPLGLSSILTPPSSSEIEDAASVAGISTSSELFRTIKQVFSGVSALRSATRIETVPESQFVYSHMKECKFDPPAPTFLVDMQSNGIQHTFSDENYPPLTTLILNRKNVYLSMMPKIHRIRSTIRGTLSITYQVNGAMDVVVKFMSNINIFQRNTASKSSGSSAIKSVVKELTNEHNKTRWHVAIETNLLNDYFLQFADTLSNVTIDSNTSNITKSRMLCVEDVIENEKTSGFDSNSNHPSEHRWLKIYQILLSWNSLKEIFEIKKEAPSDQVISNSKEETSSISFAQIALDLLKNMLLPKDTSSTRVEYQHGEHGENGQIQNDSIEKIDHHHHHVSEDRGINVEEARKSGNEVIEKTIHSDGNQPSDNNEDTGLELGDDLDGRLTYSDKIPMHLIPAEDEKGNTDQEEKNQNKPMEDSIEEVVVDEDEENA